MHLIGDYQIKSDLILQFLRCEEKFQYIVLKIFMFG